MHYARPSAPVSIPAMAMAPFLADPTSKRLFEEEHQRHRQALAAVSATKDKNSPSLGLALRKGNGVWPRPRSPPCELDTESYKNFRVRSRVFDGEEVKRRIGSDNHTLVQHLAEIKSKPSVTGKMMAVPEPPPRLKGAPSPPKGEELIRKRQRREIHMANEVLVKRLVSVRSDPVLRKLDADWRRHQSDVRNLQRVSGWAAPSPPRKRKQCSLPRLPAATSSAAAATAREDVAEPANALRQTDAEEAPAAEASCQLPASSVEQEPAAAAANHRHRGDKSANAEGGAPSRRSKSEDLRSRCSKPKIAVADPRCGALLRLLEAEAAEMEAAALAERRKEELQAQKEAARAERQGLEDSGQLLKLLPTEEVEAVVPPADGVAAAPEPGCNEVVREGAPAAPVVAASAGLSSLSEPQQQDKEVRRHYSSRAFDDAPVLPEALRSVSDLGSVAFPQRQPSPQPSLARSISRRSNGSKRTSGSLKERITSDNLYDDDEFEDFEDDFEELDDDEDD
eukprot:TRINITY_DN48413_c0_g1_i1.p1 TRINITY_DN48413_c0_g1~~TRINITY_DN48413_c0_g1_i1.p1  ORF type:complete len:509 (-),score=160.86 TRINITY_DN48413_c0_g1_i1:159-1685(-)